MEAHYVVLGLSPGAGREAVKKVRVLCIVLSRGAPLRVTASPSSASAERLRER